MKDALIDLKLMTLSRLKEHPKNPRTIDPDAFEGLKESLRRFDMYKPPVYNKRFKHITCGNQTVKALRELGVKKVHVSVKDWDEVTDNAALINDNNRFIQGHYTGDVRELAATLDDDLAKLLRFDALLRYDAPAISEDIIPTNTDVDIDIDDTIPKLSKCPECGHEF